jgi:hypothetical protein
MFRLLCQEHDVARNEFFSGKREHEGDAECRGRTKTESDWNVSSDRYSNTLFDVD